MHDNGDANDIFESYLTLFTLLYRYFIFKIIDNVMNGYL